MSKTTRQNVLLAVAGLIFVASGFRDLYRPGLLTLNTGIPSKGEIGIAMGVGLFFLGVAAFRTLNRAKEE